MFQPLSGGVEFGFRFIYHMLYAVNNYHFDYVIRMDDDVFFCLSKFLTQLPPAPLKQFHWGWVHCIPFITRADEMLKMFSYDVVRDFLNQDPNKLQ